MKFEIGDKVKIVSLKSTEKAFGLDEEGVMKTALNNIYTINYTIRDKHYGEGICLNLYDDYGFSYTWHKDDLQLVNSTELEIK
jgi:hypothetical protein